jgi:hypothetical protein
MESAGAIHVKMQENMQYVFYNVYYNLFLRLVSRARDTGSLVPTRQEIGGPPREARTPEAEVAVLQSFDDDGRRNIFEEPYLPRTYQYFRRNEFTKHWLLLLLICMLRLARENLIKRVRLFLLMEGSHFEHLL